MPGTTSIFAGATGAGGLSEAAIGEIVAAEGGFSALPSAGMAGTAVGGGTINGWDVLGSYGDMAVDAGFEGGLLSSSAWWIKRTVAQPEHAGEAYGLHEPSQDVGFKRTPRRSPAARRG